MSTHIEDTFDGQAPSAEQAGKSKKHPTMHVKIYSPYKTYYDATAESLSAVNATGPFDILPKHHNFISLLEPCDVIVRLGKQEETLRIVGGIMHVKASDVVIFLDV